MTANRDISLTFMKGMTVLHAFDAAATGLTLADLSRQTGYDRATVRRLVLTLVDLGYVEKTGNRFLLTPRVLVLAGSFLRGHSFGKMVQPLLNICAGEIGFAVALAMSDGDHAVYVAQSTLQRSRFTFGFTVGSRVPLLPTAIGRMLLAWGDPAWAEHALGTAPLDRYSDATLSDRDAVARAVQQAMADGYCIARDEFEAGVTALAVPVGGPGRARAVLGLSEPHASLPDSALSATLATLRQCAAELRPGFDILQ